MTWVVTAQEMIRLEQQAIADGCDNQAFMEEAGRNVAHIVSQLLAPPENVLLLIGKGNKGGDALVAGLSLLQQGFSVDAFSLFADKECSPLNQVMRKKFRQKKGRWVKAIDWSQYSLLLDGLLGTGFKPPLDPSIASLIAEVNHSQVPLIAIDLPSGIDPTTGEGAESALQAAATVALGYPKSGSFLRNGWNCVGELFIEGFGLPAKYRSQVRPFAQLPDVIDLQKMLPKLIRNRHKYQAGYVIGYGGSADFSGAPKLSGLAALRAGAGISRLFYPAEAKEEMRNTPLELIHSEWTEPAWQEELKRARSVFIGPGLGSTPAVQRWLKIQLPKIKIPSVLDADALNAQTTLWPKQVVLTPHRGEILRILKLKKAPSEEKLLQKCQALSDRTGAVLVLKGGPTFIFAPDRPPAIIPHGDPGMATAGSGDVLTGVIAALLAQKLSCWEAAVLGVSLHAMAGELAAVKKSSYGILARDLIENLPYAFAELQ